MKPTYTCEERSMGMALCQLIHTSIMVKFDGGQTGLIGIVTSLAHVLAC